MTVTKIKIMCFEMGMMKKSLGQQKNNQESFGISILRVEILPGFSHFILDTIKCIKVVPYIWMLDLWEIT